MSFIFKFQKLKMFKLSFYFNMFDIFCYVILKYQYASKVEFFHLNGSFFFSEDIFHFRCNKCNKFLYDEEIMSLWSWNDSDLNIRCSYCKQSLVPHLYIKTRVIFL
jgi:hypothetical protein